MSELNLFQRINEIRKGIDYIRKDKSVSTGSSGSYKAVTHDAVTAMVRDHMVKHGVVCYPSLVASLMNPPIMNVDGTQSKQMRYEATYDFVFVNVDKPEEKFTIRIESHAMDNADKSPGKALSYAKKYAILKLFEIETGEDEESRYQEEPKVDGDQLYVELNKHAVKGGQALDAAIKKLSRDEMAALTPHMRKALRDAANMVDEMISTQA